MNSIAAWLEYIESIHTTPIHMGLDRVSAVAKRLAFNWSKSTVITVGGTNGKGTTCRFLEYYFNQIGRSVATFRSPHLLDYRERVTLNGEMQDEQYYVAAFAKVEQARGDISLTYFEFGTLAALVMMQQWQPDIVLLEVGLGGRLDATNIVDNDCAVITTIGLDHQEYLGDTREAIAREKAGIFRSGKPVVIGELDPPKTLTQALQANRSPSAVINRDFQYESQDNSLWSWHSNTQQLSALPLPNIPLQNATTALAVLEILGFPVELEKVIATCKNARLEGRRQIISTKPLVMLDVAHNPQAAQNLVSVIDSSFAKTTLNGTLKLVVGMLKDKDIYTTLACFKHLDAQWYVASTAGPRGATAKELAKSITSSAVECFDNVTQAFNTALANCDDDDSIFVFGSFLTVADVLAYYRKHPVS